ncbi:hypothetical protein BC629DRAFT_806777 [Irpex lacteus]|nr:hypothetical protein BC629DRAFT_806777 [Irpex lacteus]
MPARRTQKAKDANKATTYRMKRVVRGRRAALQQIMSMPMDVIYEICVYLHPKDLLTLARSSKDLRSLFLSRTTLFLWKAARSNVPDMPPCPEDMSEPAYASLMFDTHCSTCGRRNSGRIYWRCRVRLCKSCYNELSLDANLAVRVVHDAVQSRMGWCSYIYGCFAYLEPRSLKPTVYKPYVERFHAMILETPPENMETVLKEIQRAMEAVAQSATAMENWFDARNMEASLNRDGLREGRLKSIKAKLEELGWQKELDYLFGTQRLAHDFTMLPQVHKPQELTPQGWNNIEKIVVEFMVKVQQSRLADARAAIVQSRLDVMKTMVQEVVSTITGLTLCTMEVALRIPEVVKILDPYVPTFDEDALRQNLKIWIHKYVEHRDEYARRSLVALVREKCSLGPHCDPFSLAVGTIFICTNCATGRPLLHATRHHCPRSSHHDTIHEEDEGEYANAVWAAASQWYDAKGIWSARTYEHGLTKLMKAIKCCGLDVKTATIEDLDQADVLFQERWHSHVLPHKFIPIMGWRAAVIGTKWGHDSTYFEKATEKQVLAAKPLLPAAQFELCCSWYANEVYRCALCPSSSRTSLGQVVVHLRETHGILEPADHQYFDEHSTVPVVGAVYLFPESCRPDAHEESSFYPGMFGKGLATFI